MGKVLQAAFFLRVPLGFLGRVPANIIALAAFFILGFGHPGFWLLGIAGEAAYLLSLTSSPRFRRLVEGMELAETESAAQAKRQNLVCQLDPDSQKRMAYLEKRCGRVLELYEGQGAESYVIDPSREALQRMTWMYLKLLLAHQYLKSEESVTTQEKLTRDVAALQNELQSDKLPPTLRESKAGTLRILQKRLDNLQRREQSLQEIDSDLQRIDAQVELAVDEAAMKGQPKAVSASVDLVSQLLDVGSFSDAETPTVQELEESFRSPPAAPPAPVPQK